MANIKHCGAQRHHRSGGQDLPAEKKGANPISEGAIHTCPMHPEIRRAGPGFCPICGMALEPVEAHAESGPNPELIDMTRRFWIGLVLASSQNW